MSRRLPIAIAAVAVAACAGVLGLRRSDTATFPHRAHVTAGVSCLTCHRGVADAGDHDPLHVPTDAACSACHTPHHAPRPCLDCHADRLAMSAATEARAHLRFSHRAHQPAAVGNCMRCHQGVAEGDDRLRPAMAACWGCHEHDRARDLRACDACHVDLVEEATPPSSHLIHDGDFVHDHGAQAAAAADLCGSCHRERFCAECHGVTAPAVPTRMRIADPMAASVHRAGFRSRHANEAQAAPGACSSCHQPERCAECHLAEGLAGPTGANPHPPRWVGSAPGDNQHGPAARNDPAACASCHGGAGEALCIGCHRVGGVGGSPHPPGWRSSLSLGDLPCRQCHSLGAAR